jgi:hypothetical protein
MMGMSMTGGPAMGDHEEGKSQVLKPPKGSDRRWEEKAAIAVRARNDATERRQGKPASFRKGAGHLDK